MERMYDVNISETFSIEANSKEQAIQTFLDTIADRVDPEMVEVYEY